MSYITEKNKVVRKPEDIPDKRIPDIDCTLDQKKRYNEIIEACKKSGLDGFDYIYEFFKWDEIAELAAYGGFPVRYPHYLFGMEYEHISRSYEYGYSKIYEMVCNSNPAFAYLLDSNNEIDNQTVIAHAYAHNDFFKNNVWFANSNRNMINEMAAHGTKIRRYCQKYGRDKVIRFLDLALSIQFLIDPDEMFKETQEYTNIKYDDEIITEEPRRIQVQENHEYMDDFVNPGEFIKEERIRIKQDFKKKLQKFPESPTKDVVGFLAQYSPRLRNWMRDILFMIKEESLYFVPQIISKVENEGWAVYWDLQIMAVQGYAGDAGIIDYADHHAGIFGGKYSRNPYAIGSLLFRYIEDKWNKGKFGPEWEECKDIQKRKEWDKKLGLGRQKIFEVRKLYNDYSFIDEFMDQDFCDEYEFYVYEKNNKGEWILVSRDVKDVKKQILDRVGLQSFPIITIKDANYLNLGHLLLEHIWTHKTLDYKYAYEVVKFIARLWGRPVALSTHEIEDNYNPKIPLEYNDDIIPIIIFSIDGKEASSIPYEDYAMIFKTNEKEKSEDKMVVK